METTASEKINNYRFITVKNILPNFFLFPLNISSIQRLSPITASERKEPEETSAKKKFSFSILFPIWKLMWSISFMWFNTFLWMLLLSISFLSQFSQFFISSWRLYHLVVFIAKVTTWESCFSYSVPVVKVIQG